MTMNRRTIHLLSFLITSLGFFLCYWGIVSAEEISYDLLAPIPLAGTADTVTTQTAASAYIKGIVRLAIAAAAVLAVVRIIFAGIKYMSTEAFQGKSEAKTDIQNAVWGLALAIGAYLILFTINPNLVKFNLEIPGLKIGGEFETDLGKIPTREEIDATKKEAGCLNCSLVPSETNPSIRPIFGTSHPKTPGTGCESGVPFCLVDNNLVRKLQQLTAAIQERAGYTKNLDPANDKNEINWQVTEMYPPTRPHQHACHNPSNEATGACVDAALRDLNCAGNPECGGAPFSRDAYAIQVFMEEASKLGLIVVYEVESNAQRDRLISDLRRRGISTPLVIAPKNADSTPAITGEHFSVYLNDTVYRTR